jgi:hypothetical protein
MDVRRTDVGQMDGRKTYGQMDGRTVGQMEELADRHADRRREYFLIFNVIFTLETFYWTSSVGERNADWQVFHSRSPP